MRSALSVKLMLRSSVRAESGRVSSRLSAATNCGCRLVPVQAVSTNSTVTRIYDMR